MCDTNRVKKEVERFVNEDKLFTSVDVANAIKQGNSEDKPEWIRNREVASFLRKNALLIALQSGKNYEMVMIPVETENGVTVSAYLYHPQGTDPLQYLETDKRAVTPDEFESLEAAYGATATPLTDPKTVDTKSDTVTSDQGVKSDDYSKFNFPSV
jgi:hypothetical protein